MNARDEASDSAEWEERFRVRGADFNHPAMQVAMPLVSDHDGELRCIGSAFAAAPGLAITAAHVVDDWREFQETRIRARSLGSITAFQWIRNEICVWQVDAVYGSVSTDIALLRFRCPSWWGDGPVE